MADFYDELKKVVDSYDISFHTPGHKYNQLMKELYMIDTTEIEGSDNLFSPSGIIKDFIDPMRSFYNSRNTYPLINGTTCGIMSMIHASLKRGDKILIQRNSHKSVYKACHLKGLKLDYIDMEICEKSGIPLGIDMCDLKVKLEGVKAIVLTYPSYYGVCDDLDVILKQIYDMEILILIDGAHSSLLKFSDALPKHPVEFSADIVVESVHKTLGAMTQTSLMHKMSPRISDSRLEYYLSVFQSSSPSYVLMASIDAAFRHGVEYGSLETERLIRNIEEFKERMIKLDFSFLDKINPEISFDKTKIVMITDGVGMKGYELERRLREDYRIQVEFSGLNYVVFYSSYFNEENDFIKLGEALKDMLKHYKAESFTCKVLPDSKPLIEYDLDAAFEMDSEIIALEYSENRASKNFIIPYPPGIPLVVPGEMITKGIIGLIEDLLNEEYEVYGVNKRNVEVIK